VISNQTGIPLQLMQLHCGSYRESAGGVEPIPVVAAGLPRAAVPSAGRGRAAAAQGAPLVPGLRPAPSSADADIASTLDLPTGDFAGFLVAAASCL
jgi:hypothetical protein